MSDDRMIEPHRLVPQSDVLVIGCGIAGATTALQVARDKRLRVTVLTRSPRGDDSNTAHAQGGIVGTATDDGLSDVDALCADILAAGAELGSPRIARTLAAEGPGLVREILMDRCDIEFDRDPSGHLLRGLEAAHSRPRVLHVADRTGRVIQEKMMHALRELPNVTVVPDSVALDLIVARSPADRRTPSAREVCLGAYVLDRPGGEVAPYLASTTVLATGGTGSIYRRTTNPPGARGDGLAIAFRAGASIADAEYVQFHPTALAVASERAFLISERIRGEGGVLLAPDGRPFMHRYSPRLGDLAPRDIVARAIYDQMQEHDSPHVYLDVATHVPAATIRNCFPTIHATCLEQGIDITVDPIPVAPAAHYHCGGVAVDEYGRSSVARLYAVGEVSRTGLHGANRLASTSLLEGLLWGHRAAQRIGRDLEQSSELVFTGEIDRLPVFASADADRTRIARIYDELREIMWCNVGVIRHGAALRRAVRELSALRETAEAIYRGSRPCDETAGLRNGAEAALIIARAALRNRTTRGCHFREDATNLLESYPSLTNKSSVAG